MMSQTLQHVFVLSVAALCAAFVIWQIVRTLRGRGGKAGSCCAKGCADVQPESKSKPATNRIVFLPADSLRRKR